MPGAGDTTNSTIVLDLAEELGMQELTRYCDKWEVLV